MNSDKKTLIFILVELVVLITYTNYLYVPFSTLDDSKCPENCTQRVEEGCERCEEHNLLANKYHELSFKVVVFLGLATGSVLAGAYASWKGPNGPVKFQSVLIAVAGLLLSNAIDQPISVHYVLWFVIAACSLGTFAVEYVYVMECVPPNWRLATGLLGMGLQWTCSRFYAWLMNEYLDSFSQKLFWNSLAVIIGSALVELCRVQRRKENIDEYDENLLRKLFFKNKFGSRNLYILMSIWFMHGYVYFGLAHGWAHIADKTANKEDIDPIKYLVYLSDAFAKSELNIFQLQYK